MLSVSACFDSSVIRALVVSVCFVCACVRALLKF
jgi:hypothetical protein